MKFRISEIRINEMTAPVGLDIERPLIAWRFESDKQDMRQQSVRITVGSGPGDCDMWDSGVLRTDRSAGIKYEGAGLRARTRYYVSIEVSDKVGETASADTWFETGFMDGDISAWHGAEWIGAPEYAVAADTMGVFVIESTIRILEGFQAGIVFGENDERLLNKYRNDMQLSGSNWFRAVIDTETIPAAVKIFRFGYSRDDRPDEPLYVLPAICDPGGEPIISEQTRNEPHRLKIAVTGNEAQIYLDNSLLSGGMNETLCLNPLGRVDVITYPRLCNVGYYAGPGTTAEFPEGIHISNFREPGAEIAVLDGNGMVLKGEEQKTQDPSCHSLPMLRRVFNVREGLTRARLYATARGIYGCRINGNRISDEYFAPGASQFDKHLMYQTYDITDQLTAGMNTFGCILASGWWSDALSFRMHNYNYWGDKPSFLGCLTLTYADGSEDYIVTGPDDWEYFGEGPFIYAGFYQGEYFDARKKEIMREFFSGYPVKGISKPAVIVPAIIPEKEGIFPGAACWPALNMTKPELSGHYQAPVKETETLTAVSVSKPRKGIYIYDLGQVIAGVPRVKLHGNTGQKITIRTGEMLYPDLPKYRGLEGLLFQGNLRDASSTDIYICSGEGDEMYQPEFTFHGYRYIEITGTDEPPQLSDVQSVLLSSASDVYSDFECSDTLINRFVQNVRYSQSNNFISIPTDCPQRNERMGWLGDTHIFCRTANLQSRSKNFYLRNLQAMRDMQTADGRLPSIAPFGGGFGGMTYESAMILIVNELYRLYDDEDLIREYFEAMDRWMDAMKREGLPGQPDLHPLEWLGDWLAPDPTDDYLIFNAFHYRNARIMERFAEVLGNSSAREKYCSVAEETGRYWNDTFIDKATGRTGNYDGTICDTQGSYAIALDCGVISDEYRDMAYAHLDRTCREAGYTIRTGFFGTGAVNPMLSEGGYHRTACKMMSQTAYPSWLYPVTQGATTMWERWDSYTAENGFGDKKTWSSYDHYSLGSVVSWLYEYVLGIRRDPEYPGYKRFMLCPEISSFPYAGGSIDTPYGRIASKWEKTEEGMTYSCIIPPNTSAELILDGQSHLLGSGKYRFTLCTGAGQGACAV